MWSRGVLVNDVGLINEVNQHRAWLILGWVTFFEWVNHLAINVFNQLSIPPASVK